MSRRGFGKLLKLSPPTRMINCELRAIQCSRDLNNYSIGERGRCVPSGGRAASSLCCQGPASYTVAMGGTS